MAPDKGINLNEVNYFSLEEYVNKIQLNDNVLFHMEESNKEFDCFFNKLKNYDEYAIMTWFIQMFNQEIKYSQLIENSHLIHPEIIKKEDVFFDKLQMSHKRIKDLHQFVTNGQLNYDYRKNEVRVSTILPNKEERIYWRGAQVKDIKQFMDDYIALYKRNSLSVLNTNPFLRSSLMHLLLVRIQPFSNGNKRTARMIHNMCFTESINKYYGMKLKISPLNLSQRFYVNLPTYAKRINDIYFDLEHDNNDEINRWFDFMLNMVDEQLNFFSNVIPNIEPALERISKMKNTDSSTLPQIATNQLKKVRKQ